MTAFLSLLIAVLTLFASFKGLFDPRIYSDLLSTGGITPLLLVGSKTQDMIFIPLAVILAVLSVVFFKRPGSKLLIAILGLNANFFYGYALYAMQGSYTSIYLIYLAIFSLSIYTLILGMLSFLADCEKNMVQPKGVRISVSVFLYCIVFVLGIVWLIRVSADIARHIPQDTYGVFVLDLGIVFPAIAITATRLLRNMKFGMILAGIILMKTLTICLSWGFAEWYGRFTGVIEGSYDMLMIPTILTVVSGVFFIIYMAKLKYKAA